MQQQAAILVTVVIMSFLRQGCSFSTIPAIAGAKTSRGLAFVGKRRIASILSKSPAARLGQANGNIIRFDRASVRPGRQFLSSHAAVEDLEYLDDSIIARKTSSNLATSDSTISSSSVSVSPSDHIHPEQLCNGSIPYPKSLSPSAIMEFKKCPQSFLFQYLYGLKQPTSLALAKGSMCHSALEKVFDLEPADRTLQVLQDLFRSEWAQHRHSDTYRILFEKILTNNVTCDSNAEEAEERQPVIEWDVDAEREWGKSGLQLLQNYFQLEDPGSVVRPNPVKREIWLNSHLSIDPAQGVTAPLASKENQEGVFNSTITADADAVATERDNIPTFHVRGIVDRLDMVRTRDSSPSKVSLRIVDYKTGKAPNLKYSNAMNEKIIEEAFFQLKIYALLLREKGAGRQLSFKANEMELRLLRLLYLNSESGKAVYWDLDMGSTPEERDALLHDVHVDLSNVWMNIVELVSTQDPTAFVGCDRSFCYCHKCRPRFVPRTVWEPPSS